MTPTTSDMGAREFVSAALRREGAAVEPAGERSLYALLPSDLAQAVGLPEEATLSFAGEPREGEVEVALEGATLQWLIDRARARGRRAGAALPPAASPGTGRMERARELLVLPNATVRAGTASRHHVVRLLLEFAFEAQAEERTEGRLLVVSDADGRRPSLALAPALHDEVLRAASAEPPALSEEAIGAAAARLGPLVEREMTRALAPFRALAEQRMSVEHQRILDYHERLAKEASRRRRGADASAEEALASKREAILRQRADRLEDLAERHAVVAAYWLASALTVRQEVASLRFEIRRRRRELTLQVLWDPSLREFLGPPCDACTEATMHLVVCDEAGHATCAACAAPCPRCTRSRCRACHDEECGCGARRPEA